MRTKAVNRAGEFVWDSEANKGTAKTAAERRSGGRAKLWGGKRHGRQMRAVPDYFSSGVRGGGNIPKGRQGVGLFLTTSWTRNHGVDLILQHFVSELNSQKKKQPEIGRKKSV